MDTIFWLLALIVLSGALVFMVLKNRALQAEIYHLGANRKEVESSVLRLGEERRRELLESVFQALGDACLLVDEDLRVNLANEKVRKLFGGGPVFTGKRLQEVLVDHRLVDLASKSLAKKQELKQMFDLRIPGAEEGDGSKLRYVLANVAPVKVPGETSGRHLRIVIRDVTERLETEQIRKDFVANASHELRTPLSIINGYVENLIDGVVTAPEAVEKALGIMKKHGDRLGRIVEDMLMISKLESLDGSGGGVPALKREVFSLEACIGDVVERLTPMVEEREVKLTVEVEPDADELEGDRFYWDQVFFNLMENAMKENPGSGLGLKVAAAATPSGGRVITVEDDGVGISSGDLAFVFKRFYRVAKHHSKKVKGTGLGLSIVKRAVEAHGGTIRLSSMPGVKTVFTIELPPVAPAGLGLLAGDDG